MELEITMTNLVKVLQVGVSADVGGIETYLYNQCIQVRKLGVQYDFISLVSNGPIAYEAEFRKLGSKVYRLRSRRQSPFGYYFDLWRFLKCHACEYTAVVVNSSSLTFGSLMVLAKVFGIPRRIYHSHSSSHVGRKSLCYKCIEWIDRLLVRKFASDLFACSSAAGKWLFGEHAQFEIIHNAVPAKKFLFSEERRVNTRRQLAVENEFIVGVIGNYYAPKNHVFAVEVFAEILKIRPNSRLVLCGQVIGLEDSTYDDVLKNIDQLRIGDRVMLLGYRTDVPDLLQAFDCLLMPSLFEGLPLVGIEAQFSGLNCYFSDSITKEVTVGSGAVFIPLSNGAREWAAIICNTPISNKRLFDADLVRASGYDSEVESSKIISYFLTNEERKQTHE